MAGGRAECQHGEGRERYKVFAAARGDRGECFYLVSFGEFMIVDCGFDWRRAEWRRNGTNQQS